MSNASPTVPMAEPPSYETQQARHPGQQPPQNQQQQQQQQYHHPASTTSAMNGFYHAIQQRHGQADAMIKDGEMAHQNQANVSLFSPWFNFGTSGAAYLPMPSPSLGDSINDTFVPWSENIFSSGLTPTPGQPMSQNYPILDMHPHMQGGGEDRTFIKQEAPFMPFAMPNMGGGDNKRQGPAADLRKESLASGPGSVSRVDSSSSGASAASMLIDGNARTPTPLFKSREPPRSFDSSGSYFTYPRPGGPEQMHSSYQHQPQLYSHQSEGSQQAVQPSQLFHQSQPSFQGHVPNQFMSFPPGLMQQNISQQQSYMHQPDRQNSRESTSSEASSISPAMLNSRAPRTGSPVSMYSDDVLHSISAQTSPRSQVSLHLPGPNYNNTASGSAGQYTSGPGSLLKTHRDSTSSMQTDMSADGVDGVDVNADDDPDSMRKEKNGMIWGMDAPTYYKMSAVERKKLRNKLSARTHRVKRKQKAQDTEQQLEVARDEIDQLRAENAALQARLAKYEGGQC